jgi:endonuclease/exonuclease/phosphatase (EEP) superfamily protein YafD
VIDRARGRRRAATIASIERELSSLSPERIVAFARRQRELMASSFTDRLWGAAYVISGGCSDDGFEYFRAWLMARGRRVFEQAIANPDSLAGVYERDAELEELLYCASRVYEQKTGEPLPNVGEGIRYPRMSELWDFDNAREMKRRYPKLSRKVSGLRADSSLTIAVVLASLCVHFLLLDSQHWMLDNAASATLHLMIALTVLTLVALVRRRWWTAAFAAPGLLILSAQVFPLAGFGQAPNTPVVASWLVANVYTANRRHDALLSLVRERNPDVIGLVETDERWLRALDGPLRAYEHRVLHPREDNFGIALYSRLPFIRSAIVKLGSLPAVGVTVAVAQRELDLILVHVLPPISVEYTAERNEQLALIADLRARPGRGMVIAGDFNATPYSPTFRASFEDAQFRRAGGLTGTFPAALPAPFRIPIDHALATGAVEIESRVERDIHSDHLPLLIDIHGPKSEP